MFRNIILSCILLLSSFALSQTRIKKKLITNDSLGYITLFSNGEVSYVKFDGFSPLTITEKRKKDKRTFCGTTGYIIEEKSYGTYKILKDSIFLFFSSNDIQDNYKIERKFLSTSKKDKKIIVKIKPRNFILNDIDQEVYLSVETKDKTISKNNFINESNDVTIELTRDKIPVNLLLNNEVILKIEKFKNQEIIYYLNNYKIGLTKIGTKKAYNVNELIIDN